MVNTASEVVTSAVAESDKFKPGLDPVQDNGWFFDTELLILAEKQGYRIFDLPVRWIERRESHVRILRTAFEDLNGLLRARRTLRASNNPCQSRQPLLTRPLFWVF